MASSRRCGEPATAVEAFGHAAEGILPQITRHPTFPRSALARRPPAARGHAELRPRHSRRDGRRQGPLCSPYSRREPRACNVTISQPVPSRRFGRPRLRLAVEPRRIRRVVSDAVGHVYHGRESWTTAAAGSTSPYGRLYALRNPAMLRASRAASQCRRGFCAPAVVPRTSHEGIQFDRAGNCTSSRVGRRPVFKYTSAARMQRGRARRRRCFAADLTFVLRVADGSVPNATGRSSRCRSRIRP